MPMSKRKTIYKPKKGKRISQKKLYKLPKQHGGDFWGGVKNFLTGKEDGTPLDDSAMDLDSSENNESAMDVDSTQKNDSAMDVDSTKKDDSAMDVDSTEKDDSAMDVDSEENSSNIADTVGKVGTLVGDSAKSVFNEGLNAVTQPSGESGDESKDDEDKSEPFSEVEQSDDCEELKKQIEILKQENTELKDKLIDKLEDENKTLKQGTQQSTDSFGENLSDSGSNDNMDISPNDGSSFNDESSLKLSDSSNMDISPNDESSFNDESSLKLSDSSNMDISPLGDENLPEGNENNQGFSDESLSTIDLNSTPETSATENKSPDFESDISPIELKRTDSQTPTGGTKHKKKKQRRTRRKNHGKR